MTFKEAVENTDDLSASWKPGLQALKGSEKDHIDTEDKQRLRGSVDVDGSLKAKLPNDARWDYGIGYHATNFGNEEVVYGVEIQPAIAGEIKAVVAKTKWLKKWLMEQAKSLNALKRQYIWVSSGKTSLSPSATQRKQIARLGLQHKGRYFKIPNTWEP